jgi:hypothetical protein
MTIARLNNGAIVLAKMYKGKADALTYANRTQAAKAVAKAACLGINCAVMRFGRPFFGELYTLLP